MSDDGRQSPLLQSFLSLNTENAPSAISREAVLSTSPSSASGNSGSGGGSTKVEPISAYQNSVANNGELDDESDILLVMTLDLDDGRSGNITVRSSDVPLQLARKFALDFSLPNAAVPNLARHITEAVEGMNGSKSHRQPRRKPLAEKNTPTSSTFRNNDNLFLRQYIDQLRDHNKTFKTSPQSQSPRSSIDGSVFERLHEEGREWKRKRDELKQKAELEEVALKELGLSSNAMSPQSRKMAEHRGHEYPSKNYGEMLYIDWKRKKVIKNKEENDHRHQREEDEKKELTFSPKISKFAEEMKKRKHIPHVSEHNKENSNKHRNTKKSSMEKELQECTFKPTLCKKTVSMLQKWKVEYEKLVDNAGLTEAMWDSLTPADYRAMAAMQLRHI